MNSIARITKKFPNFFTCSNLLIFFRSARTSYRAFVPACPSVLSATIFLLLLLHTLFSLPPPFTSSPPSVLSTLVTPVTLVPPPVTLVVVVVVVVVVVYFLFSANFLFSSKKHHLLFSKHFFFFFKSWDQGSISSTSLEQYVLVIFLNLFLKKLLNCWIF